MAVILSAGGSFACFYIILKLPMTISIYLALPFALPFALAGFMRIHGMSPFEYLKRKKKVVRAPILTRRPSYVVDAQQIMTEINQQRAEEKNSVKVAGKKVLLQTEDEIFLRTKKFESMISQKKSSVTAMDDKVDNVSGETIEKGEDAAIENKENDEGV